MEIIEKIVSRTLGINLRAKTRERQYVDARYIYFKICTELTNKTYSEIGKTLNKDHSTVTHAINKYFPVAYDYDSKFKKNFEDCLDRSKRALEIAKYSIEDTEVSILYNENVNLKKALKEANIELAICNSEKQKDLDPELAEMIKRVPEDKMDLFLIRLDALTKMI
jgi:cell shape-determining protein MreC